MNIEELSKEVNLLASFLNISPNKIHVDNPPFYVTPKGKYLILTERGYKLYQWVLIRDLFVYKQYRVIGGVNAMDYLTNGGQIRFETTYGQMPELISFDDINKEAFVAAVLNTVDGGVFANCIPVDGYWIISIQ